MKTRTEIIAGITTFLTMAYIIVVNPSIIAIPETGMPFSGVLTATVLLSFSMSVFMGLYAKIPFAVAPGMGINAFFAYTLIVGKQLPWPTALGLIFWAGVLFVVISATPIRASIARAIPMSLRIASAVGIGVFLSFIGLKNAGFIVANPATFVQMGELNHQVLLSLVGLFVTLWFLHRKNPMALLIGIFSTTLLAGILGYLKMPTELVAAPDFSSVLFKLDLWGALHVALIPSIIAVCLTDLFDSISTFVGVSQATGLLDNKGEPKNLQKGLLVDAFATLGAGLLGTSSGTAYIESSAGVEVGGRTGLTAIVAGCCFLPFLFLSPALALIPPYATAPALLIVGALMFRSVKDLALGNLEELVPAFLTIVMIPLTFSITQGLLWGFISHVMLFTMVGRRRELSPAVWVIAVVSAGLMVMEHSPIFR